VQLKKDVYKTSYRYLHRDHLESVTNTTDSAGNLVARMNYAPFGSRSGDVQDNDRGFTDHEHLSESGLIHMNGRVYDPVIQSPYSSQNYNRYSYVLNNPLSLVDPSGYYCVGLGDNTSFFGFVVDLSLSEGAVNWLTDLNSSYPTNREMLGVTDWTGLRYALEPTAEYSIGAGFYNDFLRGGGVEFLLGFDDQDLTGPAVSVLSATPIGKAVDRLVPKKGPLWSSTKNKSSVENAFGHFKKHKSEFPEFQNAKQYAEGTKKFLNDPPKGTLTKNQ